MFAYAASHTWRDSAEDLVQEAMVVLEERYRHLERPEDLVPVAFEVLRLKMTAAYRKAVRRGEPVAVSVDDQPLADPRENPEEETGRKELLERLRTAVRAMEPRCRELFRLKLEGKSFAEIQAVLGVRSINTIYTWDSRCRERLLRDMGGRWEARRA